MQRKIPQRQCLGCREMKPKRELIRVVRDPSGGVSLDLRGKAAGRGAYLCPQAACLKRAVKTRALARALETEIPPEIYEQLQKEMEAHTDEPG